MSLVVFARLTVNADEQNALRAAQHRVVDRERGSRERSAKLAWVSRKTAASNLRNELYAFVREFSRQRLRVCVKNQRSQISRQVWLPARISVIPDQQRVRI